VRKRAEEEITRLTRRVIDEHEEARRRIAIDLHDEFGQSISAIKIEIDMLRKEAGDRLKDQAERLEGIDALLEDNLSKIRSIVSELRPDLLDDFGLEKAFDLYLEEYSKRTGVSTSLDCTGIPVDLSKNIELALFRIVQEALINVARHADATEVRLSLLCENRLLIMTINDNGQGFDVEKTLQADSVRSHFGILGMRERASMVRADLDVSSKPGEGTTIAVRVALEC
jgi:signal transduction histidine kinase